MNFSKIAKKISLSIAAIILIVFFALSLNFNSNNSVSNNVNLTEQKIAQNTLNNVGEDIYTPANFEFEASLTDGYPDFSSGQASLDLKYNIPSEYTIEKVNVQAWNEDLNKIRLSIDRTSEANLVTGVEASTSIVANFGSGLAGSNVNLVVNIVVSSEAGGEESFCSNPIEVYWKAAPPRYITFSVASGPNSIFVTKVAVDGYSSSTMKFDSSLTNDPANPIKIEIYDNATGELVTTSKVALDGDVEITDGIKTLVKYKVVVSAIFDIDGYDKPYSLSQYNVISTYLEPTGLSLDIGNGDNVTGETIKNVNWDFKNNESATAINATLNIRDESGEPATVSDGIDLMEFTDHSTGIGHTDLTGFEKGVVYDAWMTVDYKITSGYTYVGKVITVDSEHFPIMASANQATMSSISFDSYADSIRVFYNTDYYDGNELVSTNIKVTDEATTESWNIDATEQTDLQGNGSFLIKNSDEHPIKAGTTYNIEVTNTFNVRGSGTVQTSLSTEATTGTLEAGYIDMSDENKPKIIADENTATLKYYYVHNDDEFESVDVQKTISNGGVQKQVSLLEDGPITDPKKKVIEISGLSSETEYPNVSIVLKYKRLGVENTLIQRLDPFTTKSATKSNLSSLSVSQDKNNNIAVDYKIDVNDASVSTTRVELLDGKGNVISSNPKYDDNINEGHFVLGDATKDSSAIPFDIKNGTNYSFGIRFSSVTVTRYAVSDELHLVGSTSEVTKTTYLTNLGGHEILFLFLDVLLLIIAIIGTVVARIEHRRRVGTIIF